MHETLELGAPGACVARAHGVSAIQVLDWHRQYRHGPLGQGNTDVVSLLPVHVSGAPGIIRHDGQRYDVKAVYRSYES